MHQYPLVCRVIANGAIYILKVTFQLLRVVPSFTPESGRCALCSAEKLAIMKADPRKTLNKRTEIMATCRHKRKFILEHAKIPP